MEVKQYNTKICVECFQHHEIDQHSCKFEEKKECFDCGELHTKEDNCNRTNVTCKECGKFETNRYWNNTAERLRKENLCFDCDFWTEKVEWTKDPQQSVRCVRTKGVHYFISQESDNGMKGFGGSLFHVHFNDGRVTETRNLWCQGDIPEHFKERLPDNAEFK